MVKAVERIGVHMEEIRGFMTPLGNVTIKVNRDENTVIVAMRARDGVSLRRHVTERDGELISEFTVGRKIPSIGDEVMVGDVEKTSIEVADVKTDSEGVVWVYGDNGNRYRW
jgi:hypothetical protein